MNVVDWERGSARSLTRWPTGEEPLPSKEVMKPFAERVEACSWTSSSSRAVRSSVLGVTSGWDCKIVVDERRSKLYFSSEAC